jgi:hypothetical protein
MGHTALSWFTGQLFRVVEKSAARPATHWHPGLPATPGDLLDAARFRLSIEEAEFIKDRLISEQPRALLTTLAQKCDSADCRYIWEHPHIVDFPPQARRLVAHADIFSSVMHGAALIYNLQLAELRERDDWTEKYVQRLMEWGDDIDRSALLTWSLDDFWKAAEHPGHTIRATAKRFVTEWVELARDDSSNIGKSRAARQLVVERERRLKTGQSRFSNHAARDRWRGASGAERLSFRWPQAKSHLRDLANAE